MELLVAIATCVNVGVAFVQWRAMEGSNQRADRAISAAEDANRIADHALELGERQARAADSQARIDRAEASRLAEAARVESVRQFEATLAQRRSETKATLNAMEESNRLTRTSAGRTLALMEESNRITRDTAAESNRLSLGSLRLTQMVYEEEYRPRIVAIEVVGSDPPWGSGTSVYVGVRFKNIGRTPAEDVIAAGHITTADPSFDSSKWTDGHIHSMTVDVLEPGGDFILPVWSLRQGARGYISPEDIVAVTSGAKRLYVFGYLHPGFDPFKLRNLHVSYCFEFEPTYGGGYWKECWNNNTLEYDNPPHPSDDRMSVPLYAVPDKFLDTLEIRQPPVPEPSTPTPPPPP